MDDVVTLKPATWARFDETRDRRLADSQIAYDPLNPRLGAAEEARFWRDEVETGLVRIWEIHHRGLGHLGYVLAFEFHDGHCETGVGILEWTHWGRGFAREAYVILLKILKDEGLSSTYIVTHRDNTRARRLYQRLGYTLEAHLVDEGVPMVRYRLQLAEI